MCSTPGCDNKIECPSFGLCKNCYSSLLRWSKRTKTEQLNRMYKLQLFQARVESVLPHNVVVKKYKKSDIKIDVLPGQLNTNKKRKLKKRRVA